MDMSNHSRDQLGMYFMRLFAIHDGDETGDVAIDELRELLQTTGFDYSEATVEQLIKDADVDRDGVIDYSEFVPIMVRVLGITEDAAPNANPDKQVTDQKIHCADKDTS